MIKVVKEFSGNNIKVITHNGMFHADEVLAIALLVYNLGNVEVIRTRNPEILESAKKDSDVFVIDVGGEFDHNMRNFDHHQDKECPSSIVLIEDYLKGLGSFKTPKFLTQQLIEEADKQDRGLGLSSLPAIELIKNSNPLDILKGDEKFEEICNFLLADPSEEQISSLLEVTKSLNELIMAERKASLEANLRAISSQNFIIMDEFYPLWRDIVNRETYPNIKWIISYDKAQHNWTVTVVPPTAKSQEVPEDADLRSLLSPEDQNVIFCHNNGFLAKVHCYDLDFLQK